jgi:glycosyltransferase involved in cell wall biosynthesis
MNRVPPRLVLITTNHPHVYTGGEVTFVGPELQRLARELGASTRLTVAPLHAEGTRVEVPPGVEVDTGLSDALRRARVTSYLRAFAWPGLWREVWRAWRKGSWVGIARVWRWAAAAQVTWCWAGSHIAADAPVLFYTYWRGGPTLALARLAGERRRSAAITRVHRYELYEDSFEPPFQPWHPVMYMTLALTATISKHGLDYLRTAGVPVDRLALYRLGTEPAARAAHASADDVLRIVSCSNATPVKRVPRIADAVMAFALAHPDRRLQWTHFGDGPELRQVRSVLRAAPSNLVAQLRGAVPNAAVLDHYATEPVDVFVLLSASEGLPVSIQEAVAAAIPVIATDVGGVRELVGGDNGVLLSADPASVDVVRALEQVLLDADPARRQSRRDASQRRWAEGFSAETNHTRFAQRLRSLLDSLQGSNEV